MKHFHHEVRIEAPVEHVWAFFLDRPRWPEWMSDRKTTFNGPLDQVGTTLEYSMKVMGFETKWTVEVVEVEPQRLIRMRSDYGPMDNTHRFEPAGEATSFLFDSDYEIPGRMPGFLKDLMSSGAMEKNQQRIWESFKALAEANAAAKV